MCGLIVRCDLYMYTQWSGIPGDMEARAVHGSPIEQVTLTSSSSELLAEPSLAAEVLEKSLRLEVIWGGIYLGRGWWKEC